MPCYQLSYQYTVFLLKLDFKEKNSLRTCFTQSWFEELLWWFPQSLWTKFCLQFFFLICPVHVTGIDEPYMDKYTFASVLSAVSFNISKKLVIWAFSTISTYTFGPLRWIVLTWHWGLFTMMMVVYLVLRSSFSTFFKQMERKDT